MPINKHQIGDTQLVIVDLGRDERYADVDIYHNYIVGSHGSVFDIELLSLKEYISSIDEEKGIIELKSVPPIMGRPQRVAMATMKNHYKTPDSYYPPGLLNVTVIAEVPEGGLVSIWKTFAIASKTDRVTLTYVPAPEAFSENKTIMREYEFYNLNPEKTYLISCVTSSKLSEVFSSSF